MKIGSQEGGLRALSAVGVKLTDKGCYDDDPDKIGLVLYSNRGLVAFMCIYFLRP
jgi:hypothetical protein